MLTAFGTTFSFSAADYACAYAPPRLMTIYKIMSQ